MSIIPQHPLGDLQQQLAEPGAAGLADPTVAIHRPELIPPGR